MKEREERRANRSYGGRPAQVRSIPVKSNKASEEPSPLTPDERRAKARADRLLADGVEEIFEEGGF